MIEEIQQSKAVETPENTYLAYICRTRDRPSTVIRTDRGRPALFSCPTAFPPGCLACFALLSPCTTPPPEPLLVLALVPRASLSPALALVLIIAVRR